MGSLYPGVFPTAPTEVDTPVLSIRVMTRIIERIRERNFSCDTVLVHVTGIFVLQTAIRLSVPSRATSQSNSCDRYLASVEISIIVSVGARNTLTPIQSLR